MKFQKIALFALLCLPVYLTAPDEAEVENVTPVDHTKELTDQEKQAFEEHLKAEAESHYKSGDRTGLRAWNYKNRARSLDNDIKRYLIDPSMVSELTTKEQVADLRKRLEEKIKKEQGSFASEKLRKDLKKILYLHNLFQESPKSLDEAFKKLDFVNNKIDHYNPTAEELKQKEKNTKEQKAKSMTNIKIWEKLKNNLTKYIDQQPEKDLLEYKKNEFKNVSSNANEFRLSLNKVPSLKKDLNIPENNGTSLQKLAKISETFNEKKINEIIEMLNNQLENDQKLVAQGDASNANDINQLKAVINLFSLKRDILKLKNSIKLVRADDDIANLEKINKVTTLTE